MEADRRALPARSTPSYAPDLLTAKLLAMVERSFDDILARESRDGPMPSKRERREAFRAMAESFNGTDARSRALVDTLVRVRAPPCHDSASGR
jgi:hypothetical protein